MGWETSKDTMSEVKLEFTTKEEAIYYVKKNTPDFVDGETVTNQNGVNGVISGEPKVGDVVDKGDKLCVIEAMKLMNEIKSDLQGTVVEIFVQNGQTVKHGERLFAIRAM